MISCFKGKFKVTSPRGYRTHPVTGAKGEYHKGIDLVGLEDNTVYSICDGTVRTAYQSGGAGYYVVVTMDDGRRVFYMHLKKDSFKVENGEKVVKGQALGIMGSTGASTGNHTHLEVRPKGATSDSLDICEFTGIPNKVGTYECVVGTYETKMLTSANDITWELNHSYFPITETAKFIRELEEARVKNSSLYWGYYKLANKIK